MGKASRWLVNFLLGRKEEKGKGKRKNISLSFEEERLTSPSATPTASHFKRRWSFGKLASKEKEKEKAQSSRSLDSATATLVKQAVMNLQNRHDHIQNSRPIFAISFTRNSSKRKGTKATYESTLISKAVEHVAATRIQAAYRSHLARKALHALRGLVKLQALVRGHLVRKQTAATLRGMHALMAIQVRARFQRIQMADEPKFAIKSHSSRYGRSPQEVGFKRPEREPVDINLCEKHAIVKSQNGYTNHSKIKRIEHGITTFYSGELSISKREQKYEEFSFTTHNSPRHSPPISRPTPGRSSFSSHNEDPFIPNYMANTESSRAKLRSQSEPKQRPTLNFKEKGKKTANSSAEEMINDNIQQQYSSSSQWRGVADENQEPWLVKVHRSSRKPYDYDYNCEGDTSGRPSYSEYRKSLVRDEPHATLF